MPTPAGPAHGCRARANGKSPHPDVRSRAISSNPDRLNPRLLTLQPSRRHSSLATSGSGHEALTRPTPAIVRRPAQSENTTASLCATSTFFAAAHAFHLRLIFARPTATFSPLRPAGNSPEFGWLAIPVSHRAV